MFKLFSASFAMRFYIVILSLPVLLLFSACQSQSHAKCDAAVQQIDAARNTDVPIPSTTPFDSSPESRAAYLDAYRDGYRSALVSLNVLFHKPDVSDTVQTQGWQAGASAGFSKHFDNVMRKSQQ